MELNVSTQTVTAKLAIMKLSGGLDAVAHRRLEEAFGVFLDSAVPGLLLDLSGLEQITSAGLGAMVSLSGSLAERGGKLVVSSPTDKVKALLELLGLGDALSVAATPDEAKRMLATVK